MILDLLFQLADILFHRFGFRRRHRVARHGDAEVQPSAVHTGEDGAEGVSGRFRFRFSAVEAILKVEQGLSDRIGVAHLAAVRERDVPYAPSLEENFKILNPKTA